MHISSPIKHFLPLPISVIFILSSVFLFSFQSRGSNFVELPHVPKETRRFTGWLLSSNDGFGHNYGTDEDNLRTFGIDIGASLFQRYLLHCDITTFTDRNNSFDHSRRIDELRLLGGYRWMLLSNDNVTMYTYSGVGSLLYGDFGSLSIQENAHGINNAHPRPVPHNYDQSSHHVLAYLYSDFYLPGIFTNLHGYAHITHQGDYSIDLTGRYWIVRPFVQSSFALSYKWNRVAHAGSTAQNCYMRENGPWLSNKTCIGPLFLERAFNLDNMAQYSYAGFRFGDNLKPSGNESSFGFSYSLGWPIGHNSWIEFFRMYPLPENQRLGFFLRTYHTENTIDNNITLLDDDRQLRRTKETSLGAEIMVQDPSEWNLINGFIFGGIGFIRDTRTTYDQLEARVLDSKTTFMAHAGCGLRMLIPDFLFNVYSRSVGAEIRINFRFNAEDTGIYSNPDLLLNWGLVFTDR